MTTATIEIERLPIDETFAVPADDATIERTADALRTHGFSRRDRG